MKDDPIKINEKELTAIKERYGLVGMIRFLEQLDNGGEGDYTIQKYLKEEPELTNEEIREMFLHKD